MRVIHLLNGDHVSGPERVVEHLVAHAREAEPRIVTLFDGEFRQSSDHTITVLRSRGRLDLTLVPGLARRLRSYETEIVHAHTPRANLIARLAARGTGCAVVSHVHSPTWAEGTNAVTNWARAFVDDATRGGTRRHIAVSEWLRQQLVRRGYPAARVDVCHNGVDVDRIGERVRLLRAEESIRHRLGLAPSGPVLGMFAMFRARKGADVLLRAFAVSQARRAGAMLILVGGSYPGPGRPYVDELRDLAEALGLGASVRFTGFVPDVMPWMAVTDVAILPSLFGEGLPMALLEQMAAGLPTIATASPGIEEVLRETGAGLMVRPGSVGELSRAIDAVTRDPALAGRLAEQATTNARRFSITSMVSCVERTYRSALAGSGRGA